MDKFNIIKLFVEENKIKLLVVMVFIIILISSTFMFLNIDKKTKTKTESIVFANLNKKEENDSNEDNSNELEYIYVDVKGEVEKPGVYSLKSNKRVVDAINIAGGLSSNADTTLLNLSLKLSDQMVIIVYSKEKVQNMEKLEENQKLDKEICQEETINDACISNNPEIVIVPDINNQNVRKDDNTLVDSKININTATLSTLITLPKIGNVKAKAIIDYRTLNGNFKDITEIKNVKGIGDSLFETIKELITV